MDPCVPLTEAGEAVQHCSGRSNKCKTCPDGGSCGDIWGSSQEGAIDLLSHPTLRMRVLEDFLDK